MSRQLVTSCAVIVAGIGACLYLLSLLDFGRIQPIPGLTFIDHATYCPPPGCNTPADLALPFVTPYRFDRTPGGERHEMRVTLEGPQMPSPMKGLFIPKYSDRISVFLNGHLVHADPPGRRPWNAPTLASLPPALMHPGDNELTLVLEGDIPSRIDLHPMHFGEYRLLTRLYDDRWNMGPGVTRFGFALMVMLAAGYAVVWRMRGGEPLYLWIGLSCASAAVFLGMLGFSPQIMDYKLWTLLESAAMAGYSMFMLKFIRLLLDLPAPRAERVLSVLIVTGLATTAAAPLAWVNATSTLVYLPAIAAGVVVVAIMWTNRRRLTPVDFWVFFPALTLSLGFAFDGFVQKLIEDVPRSLHLVHLMPLVTSMVCLWLILSQLARSLNRQEEMTANLSVTLAEKTRALEESYAAMAEVQQAQAVQAERGRILLDLHDGVGGQLVNTLAYLEAQGLDDPRLREALEATLQDLALMLDSLESHESLLTLLGMMRTRLESLLGTRGMQFDWQIIDEPELPGIVVTERLYMARIVQEAITNALKHSGGRTIRVFADRRAVSVSDDGQGFDADAIATGAGYGLAGMRRRAESIGVELSVASGPGGTTVTIHVPVPLRTSPHDQDL